MRIDGKEFDWKQAGGKLVGNRWEIPRDSKEAEQSASGWEIGGKSEIWWEIPRDSREAEESASCLFAETPTSKRKRCCEKDLMADDAMESWSGLFSIHRFRAEEARGMH